MKIAANHTKNLNSNVRRSLNPQKTIKPRLYCHLVAFCGPDKIATVHKWLMKIEKEMGINQRRSLLYQIKG